MSWLDVVLDADRASLAATTVNKLQILIEEGGKKNEIELYIPGLKENISIFRSTADELFGSSLPPKIIAAAMILLEMRLQETQIVPELFPSQADQDYVLTATSLILGQGNKLILQLSSTEQDDVRTLVMNARQSADFGYYIQHFKNGNTLKEAAEVVSNLEWRNSLGGLLVLWGGFVMSLLGLAAIPVYMLMSEQSDNAMIFFGLLVIIAIVAFIFITRWQKAGAFRKAMVIIENLGDAIDLERFELVDKEIDGNRNRAIGYRNSAQSTVEQFFTLYTSQQLKSITLESNIESGENVENDEDQGVLLVDLPITRSIHPLRSTSQINDASNIPSTPQKPNSLVAQFCGQCGTKIPPGAKFCPNCGNRLG